MNWLYLLVSSAIIPFLIYIIKEWVSNMQHRIDELESNMITEQQARLIISDKINPLEDKLEDIKVILNKLLDIQLGKQ